FKAIDVKTGKSKWEVATRSPMVAGVLTTGGGLVFTGDAEGFFTAYDADTGKDLWSFQCGSGHHASPVTYTLEGRQYIAVCVGWGGWTAGFAGDGGDKSRRGVWFCGRGGAARWRSDAPSTAPRRRERCEGSDLLRRTSRPAAHRSGTGRFAPGPRCRRGPAGGPPPRTSGGVSLV